MKDILDEIQAMADYEHRVSEDGRTGEHKDHSLDQASVDYREGFADGLEQAIYMIQEAMKA